MSPMNPTDEPTRRSFLDIAIAACSAITALAMTIPGVAYLWPAARGSGSERVEVVGAAEMSPGQSKTVRVGSTAVVVVKQRDRFDAFSAVCTHLGCLVTWSSDKKQFLCPCHAAIFDAGGRVVSGPPPAPLVRFAVTEVGDQVFVSPA